MGEPSGHAGCAGLQLGQSCCPLRLDVASPPGDECGVGAGFERSSVPGEAAVAVGDRALDLVGLDAGAGLAVLHRGEAAGDLVGGECAGQPGVERREDDVLAKIGLKISSAASRRPWLMISSIQRRTRSLLRSCSPGVVMPQPWAHT